MLSDEEAECYRRGRLLIYDGTDLSFETIRLDKNPACPVCSKP
jgi:hypothetical protein